MSRFAELLALPLSELRVIESARMAELAEEKNKHFHAVNRIMWIEKEIEKYKVNADPKTLNLEPETLNPAKPAGGAA